MRGRGSVALNISGIKFWLHSLRAPFLVASLFPAFLGAAEAYRENGSMDLARLIVTLSCVACIHLSANLANDFFDERSNCDRINIEPTPFSGGSRVIQRGNLSAKAVMVSSISFAALGCLQGIWLASQVSYGPVLWVGLAGVICGFAYSVPPIKASYRGFGEVLILAAFGPLAVAGGYVCQTGNLNWSLVNLGLLPGLLVLSILLINEILDIKWDNLAGKRTLVVIIGLKRGYALYISSYLGAYVLIGILISRGGIPRSSIVGFFPLFLTVPLIMRIRDLEVKPRMIKLSGLTIVSNVITIGSVAIANLI
ncbi:MAG: prenyltransferase [bacterium]